MYKIFADDICIYNDISPLESLKLISPVLTLEDNAAGSLSLTVPPTNVGYNNIIRMKTDIVVFRDGDEIWAGRVLTERMDFYNNRILYCEGELAFLNDSTQPQAEYHNISVRGFFETLINNHNSKVSENRRFTVGTVTVVDPNDSLYRYTNYEKTIYCINDKLLDRLGGHLRVRKENGVRYLDYLADYPHTNSQTIEFGENLMDFTKEWDMTEYATVILPLGKMLDESPIEALEAYLTVESVNSGSKYVISQDAVNTFGWIEKVVRWDDVTTASALLSKAQRYLSNIQFDNMCIEMSALDLHYLNPDIESVNIQDKIRAISIPHGMDRLFPVKKLRIPLDSPENSIYTLGNNIRTSLTSVNNKINNEILINMERTRAEIKQQFIAADGVLLSTIQQTYATQSYVASSIEQTASSIRTEVNQKVGTSEFGTYMQQNYNSFLLGFNGNSSVIQINTSGIDLYRNSVSDNNRQLRLNQNGIEIWRNAVNIGKIGTNSWTNYESFRGLVFDLEYSGGYMTWARKTSADAEIYTVALTYARAGAVFANEGLYFGCNVYAQGNAIQSANLVDTRANGYSTFSGKRKFITDIQYDANGDITWTWNEYDISSGMFIN